MAMSSKLAACLLALISMLLISTVPSVSAYSRIIVPRRIAGSSTSLFAVKPGSGNKKTTAKSSPVPVAVETPEKKGLEQKYVNAIIVFLLACLWDKQFMHGGIFPM